MSVKTASGSFLYFGFGSNLLRKRIQLMNPTAVFKCIAKLKDFKLSFNYNKEPLDRRKLNWCGCPATIEKEPGRVVWGVVWEVANTDMPNLDRQEGVDEGVYQPIEITVETMNNESLTCRSYQLLLKGDGDNRPSPHYMDIIIKGAIENNLPSDYIDGLKSIEHNGFNGECLLYQKVLKDIQNC